MFSRAFCVGGLVNIDIVDGDLYGVVANLNS